MAVPVFRRDSDGVKAVLNSDQVGSAVAAYAEQIAASVRGSRSDAEVVVDRYTTDRRAASVTIRDARGRLWQARDGVLTRAAASAGLEVTAR